MKSLTIGPFFTAVHASEVPCYNDVVPLGIQIEWANEHAAATIPLFRYGPNGGADQTRLEHIVFKVSDLPFDTYCPEFEIVDTPIGTFLPLEALLMATYEEFEVSRGVFTVLTELASLVPLYGSVCRPQETDGLLVPGIESAGFRLNSIIPFSGRLYVDIGWQSPGQKYVFHTCICAFRPLPQGRIDTGCWESHAVIGVSRLLARELRRRVPGSPAKMFGSSGWKVLLESASNEFQLDVLP